MPISDRIGVGISYVILAIWWGCFCWGIRRLEPINFQLLTVIIGASAIAMSGVAAKWPHLQWLATCTFSLAVAALILGWIAWDYDNRKNEWRLSKEQKSNLVDALNNKNDTKFKIFIYPIPNFLSLMYAYDFINVMNDNGWAAGLVFPNWVVPSNTDGIHLANCSVGSSKYGPPLKRILDAAGIKYGPDKTEEDLNGRNCEVGLIVGIPPSPWLR